MKKQTITFTVNGTPAEATVEPRQSLADCLRQELELTGTHVGCEQGVCGACTVMVNGQAIRSCLLLVVQAEGADILTVEGLAHHGLSCMRMGRHRPEAHQHLVNHHMGRSILTDLICTRNAPCLTRPSTRRMVPRRHNGPCRRRRGLARSGRA